MPTEAQKLELRTAFDAAAAEIVGLAEQYEARVAAKAEQVSDRDETARTVLLAVAWFAAVAGLIAWRI